MNAIYDFVQMLVGPDGKPTELTLFHFCLRGFVIFIFGLVMVRVGDRRSLAEKTGFDTLFMIFIGAVLARAINGSAPFVNTLGCAFFLMIVHRFFAFIAFHSHAFGKLIKGNPVRLVTDGEFDWKAMKRHLVSRHDLEEDLRLSAKIDDLSQIRAARLERSGDVSFIKS
jgi:uncharacterized membrane protein YcaP (DUF421 family)